MSYAVATRSSPDAIETIFRAAVEDYYSDYEQKIADLLMANDQAGAAAPGVGAAIAAFFADERYRPRLLVVAPDIYGDLIDEEGTLKYSSGTIGGSVDNSDSAGSIAGLGVVVSAHLPAGAELVTHPRAIIHRETNPIRLTVAVIGALKVELGVTAFAAFQLNRPTRSTRSLRPRELPRASPRRSAPRRAPDPGRAPSSPMADWITPADVAEELGGDADPLDARLGFFTAAIRAAVEERRADLAFADAATTPEHVRKGSIMWAALLYQQRSAPSGFDGFDAETALADAGSKRAEINRLIGWRRPVIF